MATRPGYIWSGTEWVAIGQEAIESPFYYQATAPASPSTGDIWIDSDASGSGLNTNNFLLKTDLPTELVTAIEDVPVYKMNTGSTTERPSPATNGMFRFNTTTGYPEWYDSLTGMWWNFNESKQIAVSYLLIAGGGGGSWGVSGVAGGGGGAGGYLSGETSISGTPLTVTVGAGGGSVASGNNSVFGSLTAIGGGRPTISGGSGGGADGSPSSPGAGTPGQGYAGGNRAGSHGVTVCSGGGGGGAGGVGGNATANNVGGLGGAGLSNSITGTAVTYAEGGRGGSGGSQTFGSGAANTGTGGGGELGSYGTPGNGGSGVLVIAYPSTYPDLVVSAGLTYDNPTRSGYKVYRFTGGTGTVRI